MSKTYGKMLANHKNLKCKPDPRILDEIQAQAGEQVVRFWTFPMLYQGWECDEIGYVVRYEGGEIEAFTTNHGALVPMEPSEIQENISKLTEALMATMAAKTLLVSVNGGKKS